MSGPASVRQSESIIAAVPLPLWVSDRDGQLVAASSVLRQMCGEGNRLDEIIPPTAGQTLIKKLFANPEAGVVETTATVTAPGGQSTAVKVSATTCEVDGEAVLVGWLTQEDKAGTEWLINQIAHALRNPIFAALVQSETISLRAAKHPGFAKTAGILYKQLRRVDVAINDMLLFGREARIDPRSTRVGPLVEAVAETYRQGLRGEGAEVEVEISDPDLSATWDPNSVRIILERVLDNAVQHTVTPHCIKIQVKASDGKVTMRISDDGEGIPDDILDRVFLPFFPQHQGRTGLGLSIALKFASVLGGTITVAPRSGVGTEVCCVLPQTISI